MVRGMGNPGRPRRNERGQAVNVRLNAEEVEILSYLREVTGIRAGSDLVRAALRAFQRETRRTVADPPVAGNTPPTAEG